MGLREFDSVGPIEVERFGRRLVIPYQGLAVAMRGVLDRALGLVSPCELCEHRCGARRLEGEVGFCKATDQARVFAWRLEVGEEPGLNPSLTISLSGCDLRCRFCIAGLDAFDPSRGQVLEGPWLQRLIEMHPQARTLQFLGGEPTVHMPSILAALSSCSQRPEVVWKTDAYGTPEALALLEGVVAVYLADLKFGQDGCAKTLCGVERYSQVVRRNLQQMRRQGRLIVRHLVLPGHRECCLRPILEYLRAELPDVLLSLRTGYWPSWFSEKTPGLASPLLKQEATDALALARQLGVRVFSGGENI